MGTIVRAFSEGGFWMYPILFVQIAAIVIVVERVMVLYFRRATNTRRYVALFEEDIKKGQLQKVLKKAENLSASSPLRKVVEAGPRPP